MFVICESPAPNPGYPNWVGQRTQSVAVDIYGYWHSASDLPDEFKRFWRAGIDAGDPVYFAWGCFRYFGWEPRRPCGRGGPATRANGRPALRRADIGERQRTQFVAVEIDEAQAAAVRDHARRQRIVAERAAAEMRRQAADIGERVDLDAQEVERGAVGGGEFERDAGQPEEADRISGVDEAVDEGGFDLVEIGLDDCPGRAVRAVRRLPLCRGRSGLRLCPGPPWSW